MFTPSLTPTPTDSAVSEARRFLAALALDSTLPQQLTRRGDGHIYDPFQLAQPHDGAPPSVTQEMQLLMMNHPAGGWEGIIESNRQQATTHLVNRLAQRASEGVLAIPVHRFLEDVATLAEQAQVGLRERLTVIEARLGESSDALARWQRDHANQRSLLDSGLILVQALLRGRLSLSDAVTHWNERERLALARDSHRAALQLWAALGDSAATMARTLSVALEEAASASHQAKRRVSQLLEGSDRERTWGYRVEPRLIAASLLADAEQRSVAPLLAALREGGTEALLDAARSRAQEEAARLIREEEIAGLIEREGTTLVADSGVDPVLLVAEELLDSARRRPTWQLVAAARPRTETLQIVPHGAALVEHPDLKSAAYGERTDRLAFLHVEMEVALEELRIVDEGDSGFREALGQREFFILESLVGRWGLPAAPPTSQAPPDEGIPAPYVTNGYPPYVPLEAE